MSASIHGQYDWSLTKDSEGYRDYEVVHRVRTTEVTDGPATVMNTPGLPRPGWAFWNFGNDIDGWAYCRPDMRVTVFQQKKGEVSVDWLVRQIFSNRPITDCREGTIKNPLLEPPKVSGGFAKYTEEVQNVYSTLDVARNDANQAGDGRDIPLQSSSFEPLKVSLPLSKPTVRIELNTGFLGISTYSWFVNGVNDRPLWGLARRKIRLVDVTWERKAYGTCSFYYTRTFDFEVDFTTVDRKVYDYGTKCLRGAWKKDGEEIDVANPEWIDAGKSRLDGKNFIPFTDTSGASSGVYLNQGQPVFLEEDWVKVDVIYHKEFNFLLLDQRIGVAIPTL